MGVGDTASSRCQWHVNLGLRLIVKHEENKSSKEKEKKKAKGIVCRSGHFTFEI